MPETIETLTGATDPNEAPDGKAYKLRVRIVAMCHQIEQTCEAARALAERTSKLLLELAAIDKAR